MKFCVVCIDDRQGGQGAWTTVWRSGVVLFLYIVSLDYLCRWQVQVSA